MTALGLHPDFAHLTIHPGEVRVDDGADSSRFRLLNLLAFGGAADKRPHMPALIGQLDEVVLWESTGAADALPFWNTNYAGDVYLLLMEGEVRVEFKTPDTDDHLATYIARTGDLMTLPRAIAHRTFSASGKRRISLEIIRRNPLWDRLGEFKDVPASPDDRLGAFTFAVDDDTVVVTSPTDTVRTSRDFFFKGVRVLVAYELHMEHNEFEGGFSVHDQDSQAVLRTRGHEEVFPPAEVIALFKGLIERYT